MAGGVKQRHHLKAMIFAGGFLIICITFMMWIKGQAAKQPVPTAKAISDVKSGEWQKYGTDEDGEHYFRFDESSRAFPDVFSVKTRLVYSQEGKERYIAQRQKAGLTLKDFDKLDSRTVLYGMNCLATKKELCVLEVFELTKDGATLDYAKAGSYKDWKHFGDGTMEDLLYRSVCVSEKTK
jgi:hypothetical protein